VSPQCSPATGTDAPFGGLATRRRGDPASFTEQRHGQADRRRCFDRDLDRLGPRHRVRHATSGPGGIHLLNGLYDAKLDGQPVLAITGLQFHDLVETFTQQDVELDKLYMDVCVYNARVMGPSHVENVVELACRTALAYRGVSHVTVPVDMQSTPVSASPRSERNVAGHVSELMAYSSRMPSEDQLARAAELLNSGKKAVILAGRGASAPAASWSWSRNGSARRSPSRCWAKHRSPTTTPYCVGGVGLLGTKPAQEALETCDTLLIAGSSFPYIEFYPKPGKAKAVQIELDPKRIGLRYPVAAGLVGDTARVLQALLPRLKSRKDRSFLDKAQAGMKEWTELMVERGTRKDKPMKPQVVAHELNKLLADDAIVATDSGTVTTWIARHLTVRGNMMFSCSGNLATMACVLPYAVAAAVAHPGRQVVAFADRRARDLREVQARRQDRRHQEQHARPDQMGTDGVPRQPGIRL